jgi:Mg2+-importing ATPase
MIDYVKAATTDLNQLYQELDSSTAGLTDEQVQKKLKLFGRNTLGRKKTTTLKIFLRQFKNSFLYLLLGACLISFLLGEHRQVVTILAITLLTTLFGFILEFRSQKAEEKLALLLKERCWVRRGGEREEVDKSKIVSGDIVYLQSGDIVPADCRLLTQENLLVDESTFSGESLPVEKTIKSLSKITSINQAKNLVFSGTAIHSGMGEALVFSTGSSSQIGKISQLVAKTTSRSSFEEMLKAVSRFILKFTIIALLVIFLANLAIKGRGADYGSLLLFTVALAVGIVPEALPVVALFTMSLGALNLARKKVIVKRLVALEDLGKVQVLCVDKTGTLTENQLEVAEIFASSKDQFLTFFMGSVKPLLDKKGKLKSYLDQVIFEYGLKLKIKIPEFSQLVQEAFKPDLRRDRVLISDQNHHYLVVKGAPEVLLKSCHFPDKTRDKKYWLKVIKDEGAKGRRVYGMARKEVILKGRSKKEMNLGNFEKEMIFMGLVSFHDPVKKTAFPAIQKAKDLGISVKVLTGDSYEVATWVTKELGIIEDEREVVDVQKSQSLSEAEFKKLVFEKTVFSRVTPDQKYRIIKILQKKYWTAFLGDGINDAPALKLADVSLVVDQAVDVARAASDVILLKKDLNVILIGIEQGRKIFSNVLKYIQYTLASNFGNSYSLALISLLIPFLPLLPAQILLVNLLSDFPLILVATDNVDDWQIKKPVDFDLRQTRFLIIILGLISVIFDFLFFAVFHRQAPATIQTLWFMESVFSETIFIISIRSRLPFWRAKPLSWSLALLLVITTIATFLIPFSFLAQTFAFSQPHLAQIGKMVLIVLIYFIVTEAVKLLYFRKEKAASLV